MKRNRLYFIFSSLVLSMIVFVSCKKEYEPDFTEAQPTIAFGVDTIRVQEGGNAVIPINIPGLATNDVVVKYEASATQGLDYILEGVKGLNSGQDTILADHSSTSLSIDIPFNNNSDTATYREVVVMLSEDNEWPIGRNGGGTKVIIVVSDLEKELKLGVSGTIDFYETLDDNEKIIEIPVVVNTSSDTDIKVKYELTELGNITADDYKDVMDVPGELIIPAGQSEANIMIKVVDDLLLESEDTLAVKLTEIVNNDNSFDKEVIMKDTLTVYYNIIDNVKEMSFSFSDIMLPAGATMSNDTIFVSDITIGQIVVPVVLSGPSNETISNTYSTSLQDVVKDTDYEEITPSPVTFSNFDTKANVVIGLLENDLANDGYLDIMLDNAITSNDKEVILGDANKLVIKFEAN